jgi:HNH endonuclease
MTLTQTRLKELLDYDADTGLFTWKVAKGTAAAGAVAGNLNHHGYVRIKVDGTYYRAHRLAWLFVKGSFPSQYLDHWNGIKDDNRICNLRDFTNRQNQQNRKSHREGRLVGTTFVKAKNKWRARITIKGKRKSLGLFSTELEAHEAYMKALKELDE